MHMIRDIKIPPEGFVSHGPASSADVAFEARIRCRYMGTEFVMFDVPPWGTVLPFMSTMEGAVRYFFEVETLYMPKDTVLGIRWTPRSGNNVHTHRQTLPGDENILSFVEIPFAWLSEAQGEEVLIEFEAVYPDGSAGKGRHFDVRVSRQLVFGEMHIGDLERGEPLNPDSYPDGITVKIDAIGNVQSYSTLHFHWQVRAYIGDVMYAFVDWVAPPIPCVPGQAYEFVVPAEAYSGLDVPGFDRFEITALAQVTLAPKPIPQFVHSAGPAWIIPVDYEAK